MARQSTTRICSICKQTFPKESIVTKNGLNYCPECDAKKQRDNEFRLKVTDYIQELSGDDKTIWPMIGRQIKSLQQEEHLTHEMIYNTLVYMFQYKEPRAEFNNDYGIHNVAWYYREAALFFYQYEELLNVEEKQIKDSLTCQSNTITLNRSDLIQKDKEFEEKRKKQQNLALINLDELEIEDDGELFEDRDILNYKNRLEYMQKHKYDNHTYDWGSDDD